MKRIFLVIITVFVVFILASCDVSQDLEEFSDSMMSMMAENLQGILRDPSLASSTDENTENTDIESADTENSEDVESQDNTSLE